jgi:hypothetical protein
MSKSSAKLTIEAFKEWLEDLKRRQKRKIKR